MPRGIGAGLPRRGPRWAQNDAWRENKAPTGGGGKRRGEPYMRAIMASPKAEQDSSLLALP